MEKVVSLVDTDVVIVKANKAMTDIQLGKMEKDLSEKLNKKVVAIPYGLDVIEYGAIKKEAKNIKNNKELVVEAKIDIDTEEATNNLEHLRDVAECINKELSNTCKETSNIFTEIKKQREILNKDRINKEYKLLTKEEYKELMIKISSEQHEVRWNRLSKGNKYIVCTDTEEMGIQLYSLDTFYNKPILSCNISK